MKLFNIYYDWNPGEWRTGSVPSKLIVAESKEKAIEKVQAEMPSCPSIYGSEVTVNGYEINARPIVENYTVTDEFEYIDMFDDEIYGALINIGKAKGIDIEPMMDTGVFTNEMLADIRSEIIKYLNVVTDNHIDLSPPKKSYKVGDKITISNDNETHNGMIVYILHDEMYGLLIDNNIDLAYECVSPTDYVYNYLTNRCRYNVEG